MFTHTLAVRLASSSCLQLFPPKHRCVSEPPHLHSVDNGKYFLGHISAHFRGGKVFCSPQQSSSSIHAEPLFHCLQPSSRPIDAISPVSHLASKLGRSTCTCFSTAAHVHARPCRCLRFGRNLKLLAHAQSLIFHPSTVQYMAATYRMGVKGGKKGGLWCNLGLLDHRTELHIRPPDL